MSDGGRGCASLVVERWKSSQKSSGRRSAVRSIAWLDLRSSKQIDRRIVPFVTAPPLGWRWEIRTRVSTVRCKIEDRLWTPVNNRDDLQAIVGPRNLERAGAAPV